MTMMDTKTNQRLPLWWILILAPLGYAGTNFFHWLASPAILELTGIGQYRIFSLLVYTLATGIAVIVYMFLLKSRGMTIKAAGYRGKLTRKGAMAAVIAIAIVSFIIYPLIEMGLRATGIPMYWTAGQITPVSQNTPQDMLLGILATVILAPLTEDTIFRGYVYQAFAQRTHRWTAIAGSSLIFALLHIQFFGPGMAIWILFFGTASAWLYSRFDNIYPSLLFHGLNNLWAYIILPMILK